MKLLIKFVHGWAGFIHYVPFRYKFGHGSIVWLGLPTVYKAFAIIWITIVVSFIASVYYEVCFEQSTIALQYTTITEAWFAVGANSFIQQETRMPDSRIGRIHHPILEAGILVLPWMQNKIKRKRSFMTDSFTFNFSLMKSESTSEEMASCQRDSLYLKALGQEFGLSFGLMINMLRQSHHSHYSFNIYNVQW